MANLTDLPNELLTHIFSYLPSPTLLRLFRLSLCIHTLILRILHRRVHTELTPNNHNLVFECYPPSTRASMFMHCAYLGTRRVNTAPTISPPLPSPVSLTPQTTSTVTTETEISPLGSLYCHFLPTRTPFTHTSTYSSPKTALPETLISTTLSLNLTAKDTPLTAQSSLLKKITPLELLSSAVEVFEERIVVTRAWLQKAEERTRERFGVKGEGELAVRGLGGQGQGQILEGEKDRDRILWFPGARAGVKLRVLEMKYLRDMEQPLMSVDEEPAVTYTLYYEELMIKTVHFLIKLEESLEEQLEYGGRGR